jgi:bleomycin hydrolase
MKTKIVLFIFLLGQFHWLLSQEQTGNKTAYNFTLISDIKTTPVKHQGNTGTCWSYAFCSFVETEALRKGKDMLDLSEMYIVRHIYPLKAENYISYHGKANFSEGGQAHDGLYVAKNFGLVPEAAFPGKKEEQTYHNHETMVSVLTSILTEFSKAENMNSDESWSDYLNAILDVSLGKYLDRIDYAKMQISPKEFLNKAADFNPNDYVELTSYKKYPFYTEIVLQIPDNWAGEKYYNLPSDEFVESIKYALQNGYSVIWDGDVTELGFAHQKGIAVVPEKKYSPKTIHELGQEIEIEKNIDDDIRQKAFDKFLCTDDHLMHITGLAKDQNGNLFYKIKNSWGAESNSYRGYLFMSENYLKLNTVAVMLHKNAIPSGIKTKLNIK